MMSNFYTKECTLDKVVSRIVRFVDLNAEAAKKTFQFSKKLLDMTDVHTVSNHNETFIDFYNCGIKQHSLSHVRFAYDILMNSIHKNQIYFILPLSSYQGKKFLESQHLSMCIFKVDSFFFSNLLKMFIIWQIIIGLLAHLRNKAKKALGLDNEDGDDENKEDQNQPKPKKKKRPREEALADISNSSRGLDCYYFTKILKFS